MGIIDTLFPGPSDNEIFVFLIIGLLLLRTFIAELNDNARKNEIRNYYKSMNKRNNQPPWF